MKRDMALFIFWVGVLALCLYFGPLARPWFKGQLSVYAAWIMGLAGAGAVAAAILLWLKVPAESRRRAGWGLACVALGLGLLAWLQPLLIERSHLIMYGVLGVLAWRLLGHWHEDGPRFEWAVLLAGGVGLLDELGQWLHPDRYFDWRDVGTNAVAAALGAWAARLLEPEKRKAPPERGA
jgi:hypothetical protein